MQIAYISRLLRTALHPDRRYTDHVALQATVAGSLFEKQRSCARVLGDEMACFVAPASTNAAALGCRRARGALPCCARRGVRCARQRTGVGVAPPCALAERNADDAGAVAASGRLRVGRPMDYGAMFILVVTEKMNPLLGNMGNFLVYESEEGEVVGGGQVRSGETGEVSNLVVDKEWRGRGIGSALLRALVDKHGAQRDLCLLCLRRGVPFYEREGFVEAGPDKLPAHVKAERSFANNAFRILAPHLECVGMLRVKQAAEE